ncbi:unnamed protein product [Lampetra fluviatilis]
MHSDLLQEPYVSNRRPPFGTLGAKQHHLPVQQQGERFVEVDASEPPSMPASLASSSPLGASTLKDSSPYRPAPCSHQTSRRTSGHRADRRTEVVTMMTMMTTMCCLHRDACRDNPEHRE